MTILKYTAKYFLFGVTALIVIFGIGFLSVKQRDNTPAVHDKLITATGEEDHDHMQSTVKPPPPGETSKSGYWHGDHWHKTPHVVSAKRKPPTVVQKATRSSSKTDADLPTLRQWKHHPHTSDYDRRTPSEIMSELGIPQKKIDRWIQVRMELSIVPDVDDLDVWFKEIRQKEIDILTEGLDTESAFKVLRGIARPGESFYKEQARGYAQRAVDENPDFLEGRLYLVYRGPDDARSAAEFREILRDFPDSIGALTGLGLNLAMEHPVEAIFHLKQANRMDPSVGLAALGRAYQRLGDYKTAWVYLKKAQTYPHGPILDDYVEAIEAGRPMIQPLPQAKEKHPKDNRMPTEVWDDFPQEMDTIPDTFRDGTGWDEDLLPPLSPHQKTEKTDHERAAAKAAHEAFMKHQELSQKELNDFLQWTDAILNADSPMDTNNFLMKEMEAHLKGGQAQFDPERIVRANEIIQQYGTKEGLQRLKISDPEIVVQIQLLRNQELIPTIED